MAADSDADMEVAEVTDSEEERNREAEEAGIENLQSKLLISNVRKYFLKESWETTCSMSKPLKKTKPLYYL